MITFQVEKWATFFPDWTPEIMHQHWWELALDKDKVDLALNVPAYQLMDEQGTLHILSARDDGQLIGYYLSFVFPHLHYVTSGLMAFVDIYFLLPGYRSGGTGALLMIEAEKALKERGVTKIYGSCKAHQNHSALFEALGWKLTDLCFTKMIGG